MDVFLVGLSHKTAPIELRERLAFREDSIPSALSRLQAEFGFGEAMIVSTCNRVEVLCAGTKGSDGLPELREFLCRFHAVDSTRLNGHLYSLAREDLVRHVFRVAASLDSMVVGEAQILGQLKQAFIQSENVGTAGYFLRRLLPHAFFVAKRVRNETSIGRSAVSVSSVAVELATKIFGQLKGKTILLLGAGKMSELAARSLLKSGASKIRVVNRTRERAEDVAAQFGGEVGDFDKLEDELVHADIVIVSTGADRYVITRELIDHAIRRRRYDPIFLVDISVPRNVDPKVNEIETAFSYDIDDLQSVVESNLGDRQQEAEIAEQIIQQEVHNFAHSLLHRRIGPLASSFRRKLEEICLEELGKERDSLSQADYTRMERTMLRAAHRIAHPLLLQIKSASRNPDLRTGPAEVIADAFELEDEE